MKRVLPLLIALLGALPGRAQAPAPPDSAARLAAALLVLDKLYADFAAAEHVPGLVYGLVVDGRLVHTHGVGYANLATHAPPTSQTVFRIASMTKSLVALAVLRLRDEGRLRLDDPAARYLPALRHHPPRLADAPPDTPPVTIRQLLSHSAGLPDDNPWADRLLALPETALQALLDQPLSLATAPGTAYQYSNLAFTLLGRLVTQVSGQPVQDYVTTHLLRPLGMAHTTWDYTTVPPAQLALGYRLEPDGRWQPEPLLGNGDAFAAPGGLLSTIEDFARYAAFLAAAWPPRPGPDTGPVRRSSVREAQRSWSFTLLNPQGMPHHKRPCPFASTYGYGLRVVEDCQGRHYVGHSGGLPGFGTHWLLLPDYHVSVIAFANLTSAAAITTNYAALDTLVALTGRRPRPVAVAPALRQRQAELTRLLPAWDTTPANPLFAANFFLDQDLPSRRRATQELFARVGRLTRVGELVALDQLRATFQLIGEHGTLDVSFSLTPETPGRVQELTLSPAAPAASR